jgi:hypothetical protein
MAVTFTLIKGVSCGLEYFDHSLFGFGVNLDLGIFRLTWYKDVGYSEDETEDEQE